MVAPRQATIEERLAVPGKDRDQLVWFLGALQGFCEQGNLVVWDKQTKRLSTVKSLALNGPSIQLNLQGQVTTLPNHVKEALGLDDDED